MLSYVDLIVRLFHSSSEIHIINALRLVYIFLSPLKLLKFGSLTLVFFTPD